jgi:hypothetical protein
MPIYGIKRNFTGGEVDLTIAARDDLAKYPSACILMRNAIPQAHGGFRTRPGTRFLGLGRSASDADKNIRFEPFEFASDNANTYLLVFVHNKMYVIQGDGWVMIDLTFQQGGIVGGSQSGWEALRYSLVTPYPGWALRDLYMTQSGDVIYIAHESFAERKLSRLDHNNWTLEVVTYGATTIAAPTNCNGNWHGGDDNGEEHTGNFTQNYKVTAVSADGEESLPSNKGSANNAVPPANWIEGDNIHVTWNTVPGAAEYNIYKESAGVYGFIGVAETGSFKDHNYKPDTADTPQEAENPFNGAGKYPSVVHFFQQRRWMAATKNDPFTLWGSRVGDFDNLNKSRPIKDNDAVEYSIASGRIDAIKWIETFNGLLIGTEGAEYLATGSTSEALTPVSISIEDQSRWGSSGLRPLVIGDSLVTVQRQGTKVRDLFYSFENNKFKGNELSVLAEHLFDGRKIISWAFQETPDPVVWAVLDDGTLLSMTYLKEHQVFAWAKHPTLSAGGVKEVAVVRRQDEDIMYLAVERMPGEIAVERLEAKWRAADGIETAFFLDSALSGTINRGDTIVGGLDHLDGTSVAALLDGKPYYPLLVTDGEVELPVSDVEEVIVGRPYTTMVSPLPFQVNMQDGTTQGRGQGFGRVRIRFHESSGGSIGVASVDDAAAFEPNVGWGDDQVLWPEDEDIAFDVISSLPEEWGAPIQPFTGVRSVNPPGGFGPDYTVILRQDKPLPFNVVSMTVEVEYEQ